MCTSQLSKWNCSRNDSANSAPIDENLVKKLNLEIFRPQKLHCDSLPRNNKHLDNYSIRSSHPELFLRKGDLKMCSKVTGEHPCRSVISIKVFTLQWILFHKIWS